ncbi:MAG: DedA family protein [Pseudomonadota bacterium]
MPVVAFAEACVGVGLFVSSIFLVVLCSFLYTEQLATFSHMLMLAFAGAFAADQSGFHLGRVAGPHLHQSTFAKRHRLKLDRAESLIRQFGWGAILIGRFIPAIRSLVPALTGISGLAPRQFLLVDLGACLLWTTGLGLIVIGVESLFALT